MAAHSYWRVFINSLASGTYVSVGECEMRATLGGADQCSGGAIFADNTDVANRFRIFDNDTYAYSWCVFENGNYWGYQFSSPVEVAEIRIILSTYYGAAIPASLSFQYSDNGSTWTNEVTATPITWLPNGFGAVDNLFTVQSVANNYSITGNVTVSVLPQGVMSYQSYIIPPTSNWVVIHNVRLAGSKIASSADGTKIARVKHNSSLIYISLNSGGSWSSVSLPSSKYWSGLCSSDDFSVIFLAGSVYLYISFDFGQTWETRTFALPINCISCSGDGSLLYGGFYALQISDNQLFIGSSLDSFTSFELKRPLSNPSTDNMGGFTRVRTIVSSIDGVLAFIVFDNNNVLTTSNNGADIASFPVNYSTSFNWAASFDFNIIYRIAFQSGYYLVKTVSGYADVGVIGLPYSVFYKVECSSDGKNVAISIYGGKILYSSDYGITWKEEENVRNWLDVAVSSVYAVAADGYLYSMTVNTPQETITFSAPLTFNTAVATAYHETISFSAALDFNTDRGSGNFLGISYGTENGAITTFDNMPYEFSCNFKGKTLFANEFGLFEYGGTTDNGAAIVASIKTDSSNKVMGQGGLYATQHRKRLPASKVDLNVEASEPINLTVTVDGDTYPPYTDATIKTGMAVHPVKVGRGLDGVHWQLEVENFETLESIEFEPVEIRRRGK